MVFDLTQPHSEETISGIQTQNEYQHHNGSGDALLVLHNSRIDNDAIGDALLVPSTQREESANSGYPSLIKEQQEQLNPCTSNNNIHFVCLICNLTAGDDTIECTECCLWIHFECANISPKNLPPYEKKRTTYVLFVETT